MYEHGCEKPNLGSSNPHKNDPMNMVVRILIQDLRIPIKNIRISAESFMG